MVIAYAIVGLLVSLFFGYAATELFGGFVYWVAIMEIVMGLWFVAEYCRMALQSPILYTPPKEGETL